MAPNDRSGRRDPVFGDAASGRTAPGDNARGPRFTLDDDDSADRPRAGASDIRADARDEAVWRARTADYDDLYEDQGRRPPYMIIGGILAVIGVAARFSPYQVFTESKSSGKSSVCGISFY